MKKDLGGTLKSCHDTVRWGSHRLSVEQSTAERGDGECSIQEFNNSFTSSLKLDMDKVNGKISITVLHFKILGERLMSSASAHLTLADLSRFTTMQNYCYTENIVFCCRTKPL